MSFKKKIEYPGAEDRSVQIAQTTAATVDFLVKSSYYKTRKEMKIDEEEMTKMVDKVLGTLIEDRINCMILDHLMMEYAPKKLLEAYYEIQGKSGKAIKAYFEDLVCKQNAERNKNKKSV